MGLKEYRRKRDFAATPEPSGAPPAEGAAEQAPAGLVYIIQKHAASRLHYDFRLELDAVLKSWAVPKGPSLDPGEKRLAAQVEDHPLDYASFEGIIPKGQYGGGTVLLWDRGTWEPKGDPRAGLERGRLKLELHGEKLRGGWTLVRMKEDGPRTNGGGKEKSNWLLFKERDAEARAGAAAHITEARPESVATGRSIEEIAAARDATWQSDRAASPTRTSRSRAPAPSRARSKKKPPAPPPDLGAIEGARRRALPKEIEPELATLVAAAPEGDEWLHEMKLDGYRTLAFLAKGKARLVSRNGKDWTARMPELARAIEGLPATEAVLDGEAVIVRPDGTTSFNDLQVALGAGRSEDLVYYLFDLLFLDGWDMTRSPLVERKGVLEALIGKDAGPLRVSGHVIGSGEEFFRQACRHGLEGIVSKRAAAGYVGGRTRDWQKTKCVQSQELVIGGYTGPSRGGGPIAALLLGVNQDKSGLVYAGRVGTGFTVKSARELHARLAKLARKNSPFAAALPAAAARGAHWVEPRLVAAVQFTEWTADGLLRHPSFQGLREDKAAKEVVRETPVVASAQRTSRGASSSSSGSDRVEIAGVRLTHPDRVLYPGQGITKLALARYYEAVASHVLPHVEGRPIALLRCPEGHAKECFFQKHSSQGMSEAIHGVDIVEKGASSATYLYVDSLAGLIALVQMGVLEIHPWGCRIDDVERPDRLTFDLDPDPALPWARVAAGARLLRERLEGLGLASFVKTTGGKGLHVVVPIRRGPGWDEAREFARNIAEAVARERPEEYTARMAKADRHGKVFIDYLRNGRGATAVAAYSTRARDGAPVSTPLAWDELGRRDLRADALNLANVPDRLARLAVDPWEGFATVRQGLTRAVLRAAGVK